MSAIKNVTLVGGSGNLGTFVLEKLLASKKFNVQVLKRPGSSSTYAAGAKVIEADTANFESLKAAFQGQDAVVSIISDAATLDQKVMTDAAIASGVKRFLPSDFGSDMANPNSRKVPVYAAKVIVEDYLVEKSKTTDLTYTFVYNGAFTDFCIEKGIILDVSKYQPTIYNDGEARFSTTSMPTVGDAVVGVLTHPSETKNRAVYVSEISMSQNQLLALAKRIAPSKPWAPKTVELDPLWRNAVEKVSQGQHDFPTIITALLKPVFDPEFGAYHAKSDNELLGIKGKSEEYLAELLTPLLK